MLKPVLVIRKKIIAKWTDLSLKYTADELTNFKLILDTVDAPYNTVAANLTVFAQSSTPDKLSTIDAHTINILIKILNSYGINTDPYTKLLPKQSIPRVINALPWKKTKHSLNLITCGKSIPLAILAVLYSNGFVFNIGDILTTKLDAISELCGENTLDLNTGIWFFRRRGRGTEITLPETILDALKSKITSGQKFLFQGTGNTHSSTTFAKQVFKGHLSPSACQKSYIAWMLANNDLPEVISHINDLGIKTEFNRMLQKYYSLIDNGTDPSTLEQELLLAQ